MRKIQTHGIFLLMINFLFGQSIQLPENIQAPTTASLGKDRKSVV